VQARFSIVAQVLGRRTVLSVAAKKAAGKAGIVIAAIWVMPNPVFDDAVGNLLPSEACVANEIAQKIGVLLQVVGLGNLLRVGGTIAPTRLDFGQIIFLDGGD